MRMLAFVVAKIGKFLVVFFVPLFPKRKTALMAEFDILFFHFLKHSFLDIRYPFFRQGVLPDSYNLPSSFFQSPRDLPVPCDRLPYVPVPEFFVRFRPPVAPGAPVPEAPVYEQGDFSRFVREVGPAEHSLLMLSEVKSSESFRQDLYPAFGFYAGHYPASFFL